MCSRHWQDAHIRSVDIGKRLVQSSSVHTAGGAVNLLKWPYNPKYGPPECAIRTYLKPKVIIAHEQKLLVIPGWSNILQSTKRFTNQSVSCRKGVHGSMGVSAKNPQIANLDLVDGGQAPCLIYGGFGTNAAAASTLIQHLQKSPMLTSNMFWCHDDDFDNVLQGNAGNWSKTG